MPCAMQALWSSAAGSTRALSRIHPRSLPAGSPRSPRDSALPAGVGFGFGLGPGSAQAAAAPFGWPGAAPAGSGNLAHTGRATSGGTRELIWASRVAPNSLKKGEQRGGNSPRRRGPWKPVAAWAGISPYNSARRPAGRPNYPSAFRPSAFRTQQANPHRCVEIRGGSVAAALPSPEEWDNLPSGLVPRTRLTPFSLAVEGSMASNKRPGQWPHPGQKGGKAHRFGEPTTEPGKTFHNFLDLRAKRQQNNFPTPTPPKKKTHLRPPPTTHTHHRPTRCRDLMLKKICHTRTEHMRAHPYPQRDAWCSNKIGAPAVGCARRINSAPLPGVCRAAPRGKGAACLRPAPAR